MEEIMDRVCSRTVAIGNRSSHVSGMLCTSDFMNPEILIIIIINYIYVMKIKYHGAHQLMRCHVLLHKWNHGFSVVSFWVYTKPTTSCLSQTSCIAAKILTQQTPRC